jgi:hypothetical protein
MKKEEQDTGKKGKEQQQRFALYSHTHNFETNTLVERDIF